MTVRTRWRQIALIVAILSALGAVFCLYWRPELAFDLATRIWSCF
ncbi:hypothetical protein [Aquabacterium sp. NJ1]|nr:hypothetical protein [Aquabacterium sp. NJ1]